MLPTILFVIAIVAAIIHLACRKKTRTSARVMEIFLAYMIPLYIGVGGIVYWIVEGFYGAQAAQMMGMQPSVLQIKIAAAALGFGVLGILSIWFRKGFWLATVLSNVIFTLGWAWVHYMYMMPGKMMMQGAKPHMVSPFFMFTGFVLIPIILFVMTVIYSKQNKFFKN